MPGLGALMIGSVLGRDYFVIQGLTLVYALATVLVTLAIDVLTKWALEGRTDARAQRDWARADEIRDRLKAAGIEVTDTSDGPQWSLADGTAR